MEKLPKYNINDKVWAVKNNEAKERTIVAIVQYTERESYYYAFEVKKQYEMDEVFIEDVVFKNKGDYIASLEGNNEEEEESTPAM